MEIWWLKGCYTIKIQTKHEHLGSIPVLNYFFCVQSTFKLITHYRTFKDSLQFLNKKKYLRHEYGIPKAMNNKIDYSL